MFVYFLVCLYAQLKYINLQKYDAMRREFVDSFQRSQCLYLQENEFEMMEMIQFTFQAHFERSRSFQSSQPSPSRIF